MAGRALVSTGWLAERLGTSGIAVLDATYMLPGSTKKAAEAFENEHIPGAVFFDIDAIADHGSELPHMLPTAAQFGEQVGALGVGSDSHVIVYDSFGLMSAARVWWMFRVFGHAMVSVLDGGLPKWKAEGRPVAAGPSAPASKQFVAKPIDAALVRGADDVADALRTGAAQVVDARSAERFSGSAAEIWPGRRSGHMPGSKNLPFTDLIDPATRTVIPVEDRLRRFAAAGLDVKAPIIASCGSGVTACILALSLDDVPDATRVAVYDGSWAEWGLPGERPVAVSGG